MSEAEAKLARIREELNLIFLERAELIDGALCALLSKNHLLIIGPTGTAKSMLADELCRRIEGAAYFQWLLTRFSTPEEIFGAVSLKALAADDYRRVTTGKLPEAHIAFLDEIFKANSSILNALLAIINERVFHNGRERQAVPLVTMFAAANELPDEEELTALYDRFMFRFMVDYIAEDFRFLKMLSGSHPATRSILVFAELEQLWAAAASVAIPHRVLEALAALRKTLSAESIAVSDRRWHNSLDVLRAHALLMGRHETSEDDLLFLEHVLWRDPDERPKVRDALHRLVKGYEEEARELLIMSQEIGEWAEGAWETDELRRRALVEAHSKLANILARFDKLAREAAEGGRPVAGVEAMRAQVRQMRDAMLARL